MLAATYLYLFSFVLFKWWHLQWGHINRTPNLAVHNLPVSEWAKSLLFFVPPDEVLNTSIVMSLWGRDSSICDPFCCNYTPSTKWDMTWVSIASSSLAVFFVWGFLFFLEPLQCLFCRPSVKPTFVWGTDILNNDRWKTWGRTRCNDKVETLDRNRQVRL